MEQTPLAFRLFLCGYLLGAYNPGAARAEHYGGVPPFPETVGYVSGILSDLGKK